jgi:hypothetical protein
MYLSNSNNKTLVMIKNNKLLQNQTNYNTLWSSLIFSIQLIFRYIDDNDFKF